jgi:hypothetical protein
VAAAKVIRLFNIMSVNQDYHVLEEIIERLNLLPSPFHGRVFMSRPCSRQRMNRLRLSPAQWQVLKPTKRSLFDSLVSHYPRRQVQTAMDSAAFNVARRVFVPLGAQGFNEVRAGRQTLLRDRRAWTLGKRRLQAAFWVIPWGGLARRTLTSTRAIGISSTATIQDFFVDPVRFHLVLFTVFSWIRC